jgi:hypothetical protein
MGNGESGVGIDEVVEDIVLEPWKAPSVNAAELAVFGMVDLQIE